MAITAGRASGSTSTSPQTVANATWTDIFAQSGSTKFPGCEEVVIGCVTGSAAPLLVAVQTANSVAAIAAGNGTGSGDTPHRIGVGSANVPDEWFELLAGESLPFAGSLDNKIVRVMISGNGGTATAKWTVTKS